MKLQLISLAVKEFKEAREKAGVREVSLETPQLFIIAS